MVNLKTLLLYFNRSLFFNVISKARIFMHLHVFFQANLILVGRLIELLTHCYTVRQHRIISL